MYGTGWVLVVALLCLLPASTSTEKVFTTVSDALQRAISLKKDGKLNESIDIFNQILRQEPNQPNTLHLSGLAYRDLNNFKYSIDLLKSAVHEQPDNVDWILDLADTELLENGPTVALKTFQLALSKLENNPSTLNIDVNNITRLLIRSYDSTAKLYMYHMLQLFPTNSQDYFNTIELSLSFFDKILSLRKSYQTAISEEDLALVHSHMANGFSLSSNYIEAVEHMKIALKYHEKYQYYCNLGMLYFNQGYLAKAVENEMIALALVQQNPEAEFDIGAILNNLGALHRANKDEKKALYYFNEAVKYIPNSVEVHNSLGDLYHSSCLYKMALRHWELARLYAVQDERMPTAIAVEVKAGLSIPHVYQSLQHLAASRDKYDSTLAGLLNKYTAKEGGYVSHFSEMTSDLGYYLVYQGFSNIQAKMGLHRLYSNLLPALKYESPLVEQFPSVPEQHELLARCNSNTNTAVATKKIKLGFFSEYFYKHSVTKLILNVYKLLFSSGKYTIVLFLLQNNEANEDVITQQLVAHSHQVVYVPGLKTWMMFHQTRELVAKQLLDVLVYPEIGMGRLSYFLSYARLARRQVAFWGHGITTGVSTVDYFITSQLYEAGWNVKRDGPKYSEKVWMMKGLTTSFLRPTAPSITEFHQARVMLFPKHQRDSHRFYVLPQTTFKFHPAMDRALVAILQRDPQALLVMIEGNQPAMADVLRARLGKELQLKGMFSASDRVIFLPNLPEDKFLSLLVAADVVLDTFPSGSGVGLFEALSVEVPMVTLAATPWIPQYSEGIYSFLGVKDLITRSTAEYVSLALRIAHDKSYKKLLVDKLKQEIEAKALWNNGLQVLSEWNHMLEAVTMDE